MDCTIHSQRPPDTSDAVRSRDVTARAIRVCHVSMCLETGGLERLLVEFARNARTGKVEPSFVALSGLGKPAQDIRELGFPVESVADSARGKLARLLFLISLFRDRQIDIVHSHNTLAEFYAATAAKLAGVPVVVNTQHGRGCGASWRARTQFRIANLFSDRIVGVSEDAAELCRRDDRFSRGKTTTIWNGIDLDRFEYRGPATAPVAISVARLSPENDFSTLLRTVWILIQDFPEFRLQIVGDGPEREHLRTLSRNLKLDEHIEFLGECNDVPQRLAKAAFFVSATRTEGISLTLLEAMATGLPVVTTRVGGNPEIVQDGRTGMLVREGCPELLASAMREMLHDRDAWPVMGELARQRVEQHFNVRNMVQQYESLYDELLSEKTVFTQRTSGLTDSE
jgi:glycosyltransferase involved in cell wall biosynthesis